MRRSKNLFDPQGELPLKPEVKTEPAKGPYCGECLMAHVDCVPVAADGTCSCCATGHKLAEAVRR